MSSAIEKLSSLTFRFVCRREPEVLFEPHHGLFIATIEQYDVGVWDIATGKLLNHCNGFSWPHSNDYLSAQDLTLSPNGKLIAAAYLGGVRVWYINKTPSHYTHIEHYTEGHRTPIFSPKGGFLAYEAYGRGDYHEYDVLIMVRLQDYGQGYEALMTLDNGSVSRCDFDPHEVFFAATHHSGIEVLNLAYREPASECLPRQGGLIGRLDHPQFGVPSTNLYVTIGDVVHRWDLKTDSHVPLCSSTYLVSRSPQSRGRHYLLSPDTQIISAEVSDYNPLGLWYTETGKKVTLFDSSLTAGEECRGDLQVFSPDGRILATALKHGKVIMYNLQTGQVMHIPSPLADLGWDYAQDDNRSLDLIFSPDSSIIVLSFVGKLNGEHRRGLRAWRTSDGALVAETFPDRNPRGIGFDRKGDILFYSLTKSSKTMSAFDVEIWCLPLG